MRTSPSGIDLIKSFEGLRLTAYKCPAGIPTIGYGSTRGVKMGDVISEEDAEMLLIADLGEFEDTVNDYVDVDLEQHEFDALVAFSYNVGSEAFRSSTLLRLLNQGAPKHTVGAQFGRWNKAGGKVLPGLVRRREAERRMFEGLA